MSWHFSVHERCTFFVLNFTAASRTHNDLASVMFAPRRFDDQWETHSSTTAFYMAERIMRGVK
jgi:hypothetical protein